MNLKNKLGITGYPELAEAEERSGKKEEIANKQKRPPKRPFTLHSLCNRLSRRFENSFI